MTAVAKEGVLKVGEEYRVECIHTRPWYYPHEMLWLPVFGPIHADCADSGASPDIVDRYHMHVDMRFITGIEMGKMGFTELSQGAVAIGPDKGWKVGGLPTKNRTIYLTTRLPARPIGAHITVTSRWETRRCLRQWTNVTPDNSEGRKRFEERYKLCTVDLEKPRCPHQGFDLSVVEPRLINGRLVRVCPGHVLGWCAQTGKLVPRHNS